MCCATSFNVNLRMNAIAASSESVPVTHSIWSSTSGTERA